MVSSPAVDKILCGLRPKGVVECEAFAQKVARDDLSTLQHKLRFGPQQEGANLEHRAADGETDSRAPCVPENAEKLPVGKGIWRGQIDDAFYLLVADEEVDRSGEVVLVNP